MRYILTLVASEGGAPLSQSLVKGVEKILRAYRVNFTSDLKWLERSKALDIALSGEGPFAMILHLREFFANDHIDFFITHGENRIKKLILADMDSTIVSGETLDDLAAFAGLKDKVSEITARAMEGKLDFHQALQERVILLKGLSIEALNGTLDHLKLNPKAEVFIRTMKTQGAVSVLVSGGFTFFTNPVAKLCGFDHHHGNILDLEKDHLTGKVRPPILDKHSKVDFLNYYMEKLNLSPQNILCIGDGANDIPMLKAAGLGIGYHPKETVKSEISNCILYGDFTAALHAQGLQTKDFKIDS